MAKCPTKTGRAGSGVQLPYGEAVGGRMLHVSEVPSGLACGCVCPGCGARLSAHKGTEVEHHFAHEGKKSCTGAYETMLHKVAKQVLLERGVVKTPAVIAVAGDERRRLFPEQDFKLTSVEEEVPLPGMQPDILGRRGEYELLIEVKVTHACGEEKLRRIREQRRAAIEIDMSKVPRDAPKDVIEDAIVSTAPRDWLFNAKQEEAAEQMRREQQQREADEAARKQAQQARLAERLLEAWHTKPVVPRTFRVPARVTEGALEHLVGLPIGDGCFTAPTRYWQAVVLDSFVLGQRWQWRPFHPSDVLKALQEAKLVKPVLDGYVSKEAADAARAVEPAFLSPYEAVETYLAELGKRGALTRWAGGRWTASNGVVEAAQQKIAEVRAREERHRAIATAVVELMAAVDGGLPVDIERWMHTRPEGLDDTPEAIAAQGGWRFEDLKLRLRHLKDMVLGRGAVEENLLGFPLEAVREERRRALAEEKRQRDEQDRRRKEEEQERAEELRRRREEEARAAAVSRRSTLMQRALELLGDEHAAAFTAEPRDILGGRSLEEVDALSEDESHVLSRALDAANRRLEEEWERERLVADCRWNLQQAAKDAFGRDDMVQTWLHSGHPALGGQHPWDVCVDETGLEKCLAALKAAPRKRR